MEAKSMKIIYNKYLPVKDYAAINLFGIIFASKESYPLKDYLCNHEAIHTAQMRDLLFLFFYLWYGIEWVIRLIQYRNTKKAYYNISFEREAYRNQYNSEYLKQKKYFSFTKYLRKG